MLLPKPVPSENPSLEWFVLVGGRYQGPHSFESICEQLEEGTVARDTLAWRDGMTDWEQLGQIDAFKAHAEKAPASLFSNWDSSLDFIGEDDEEEFVRQPLGQISGGSNGATFIENDLLADAFGVSETNSAVEPLTEAPPEAKVEAAPEPIAMKPFNSDEAWAGFLKAPPEAYAPFTDERKNDESFWKLSWQTAAIGFCLVAGTALVAIAGWHSLGPSLPALDDVSREETRELKAAIRESKSQGAAVAIAVSNTDTFAPYFYLATNLPDQTVLNVLIEGIPETLLDKFKVSVRATSAVKEGLARTPAFRQENGQPFPRGEYRITISCGTCDKNVVTGLDSKAGSSQILAQKTYFLGGPRDLDYDQKLKSYHEQLRAQAKEELAEIGQVTDTLEIQFTDTTHQFQETLSALARNKQASWPGKTWASFSPRWLTLQDQLNGLFVRWTPEALDAAYFHAQIYSMLRSVGERVGRIHQMQDDYLKAGKVDFAIEAQIEAESAQAWNALRALRIKVEAAEKLPASANGMPQRP